VRSYDLRVAIVRMLRLTELEGEAPTEFLIFRRGVNETTKGPVLFDAAAAASVMADYAKHGVDLMIDLGHASLHSTAHAALVRDDAGDARGWFKLELRDGDLYAIDVRWTPDGARRLAERTQRYISPAVYTDKNDRAVALVNVALVSMPATIGAQALIAASKDFSPKARARAYVLLERIKNGS
jgi:phage I-like protein